MKYMVMECHMGYAVLLDENGRFVKAANFHYQVGQTVTDPVLMKQTGNSFASGRISRAAVGIAAAAACLFLLFGGYYQNYLRAETSIYLTINPSVCMELNRKGDVVRLSGANEDGERLLEGYEPGSRDRLEIMDELIHRAIEMGFLSEGGLVTIDINAPDEVRFQQYGVEFRTNLTEYLEDQLTVEIQIVGNGAVSGSTEEGPEAERSDEDPDDSESGTSTGTGSEKVPDAPKETETPADSSVPAAAPAAGANQETGKERQTVTPASEETYSASDYGTDYESTDYGEEHPEEPDEEETDYEEPEDSSDYEEPENRSDYEEPEDNSDYETTDYE